MRNKKSGEKYPRKEQMTIRLPKELKERLQREAERKGYTITDSIKFILKNHQRTILLK